MSTDAATVFAILGVAGVLFASGRVRLDVTAILVVLVATASISRAEQQASAATRNVVLITIDTLRADALGAYGNARKPSPQLDRLAKQGVGRVEDSGGSTRPRFLLRSRPRHGFSFGR